jgi:hypothetical protein
VLIKPIQPIIRDRQCIARGAAARAAMIGLPRGLTVFMYGELFDMRNYAEPVVMQRLTSVAAHWSR